MSDVVPARRTWIDRVKDRWPTALALVLSALTLGGGGGMDEETAFLGHTLLILPLLYLMVAKLQRRKATWPLLMAGLATVVALRSLDVIAPAAVYSAVALIFLIWGAVDGQLHRPGAFRAQSLGMLGFGALALAGLAVDPDLGRYLVAAGWFLHGVWDLVHLKLDKVVARSFAEWCCVVDVVIAAQLVFML